MIHPGWKTNDDPEEPHEAANVRAVREVAAGPWSVMTNNVKGHSCQSDFQFFVPVILSR